MRWGREVFRAHQQGKINQRRRYRSQQRMRCLPQRARCEHLACRPACTRKLGKRTHPALCADSIPAVSLEGPVGAPHNDDDSIFMQAPPPASPSTPRLSTEEGILSAATADIAAGGGQAQPEAPAASDTVAAVLSTGGLSDAAASEAGQDDAAAEAAAIAAASSRADADEGVPNMRGVRPHALNTVKTRVGVESHGLPCGSYDLSRRAASTPRSPGCSALHPCMICAVIRFGMLPTSGIGR